MDAVVWNGAVEAALEAGLDEAVLSLTRQMISKVLTRPVSVSMRPRHWMQGGLQMQDRA